MLKRFIPEDHYEQGLDPRNGAPYVFLMQPSRYLLSQYYMDKYGCKIILLSGLLALPQALAKLDKSSPNYRIGFFIGRINDHSLPLIYLRENGEAALLYPDSEGQNPEIIRQLKQFSPLPIYATKEKRQADFYSCAVDAFIILRDSTALNKDKNNYLLPDLLARLKERAEIKEDYIQTKLPDTLLKTSQHSSFTLLHQENLNHPVHKQETLNEFRERYSFKTEAGKKQCAYLRIKGLKLAHTVEIQFYLDQLQTELGSQWTEALKAAFIKQAKMEFTLQGDFFLNLHREGLYKFASDFLEKAKQNDLANLLNRCYLSPATNINKIQHIAETLVQIIQDNEYWKQKTYWGLGVPDGISLMQQELKLCSSGTSVVAKIYRVRKIAADRRKSKSIFFLVTGREERNSLTDDFYKLFSEDWLKTPLFDKIYADWKKPRPQDDKEPLPSQADYKKTRVRF